MDFLLSFNFIFGIKYVINGEKIGAKKSFEKGIEVNQVGLSSKEEN